MARGQRMTLSEAQDVLGHEIALTSNLGWLTGRVISVVDRPQITVEDENGKRHHLVIDIVQEWLTSDRAVRSTCAKENGE